MKPQNITRMTSNSYTEYDANNMPVRVTRSDRQLSQMILTTSGGGKGDFIHPVEFAYQKVTRNPYAGTIDYYSDISRGVLRWRNSGVYNPSEGPIYPQQDQNIWNTVQNKALSKLYADVRQSDLNFAVTIGEMRETARMFAGAVAGATAVIQLLSEAKRNPFQWLSKRQKREAIHNPSKAIAQSWLNVKYGWMPAIQDVYGYANYAVRNTVGEQVATGHATERVRKDVVTPVGGNSFDPGRKRETTLQSYRVKYGMVYRVGNAALAELSRITSLDPLRITWELLPLSFVADWFFDIGGYLEIAENARMAGYQFQYGYRTRTYLCDVDGVRAGLSLSVSNRNQGWNYNDQGSYRERSLSRIALSSPPKAIYPTSRLSLGGQRIMSAASLMRTIIPGIVFQRFH